MHVKRLLNPLCKLSAEVIIELRTTAFTILSYFSSRSLTLHFPFLDQSSTALPPPSTPPLEGACMATAMYRCTRAVRLCLSLPGAAAMVAQRRREGKGHEPGRAELGQREHSWAISAPVRQQQTGGMGSIIFSVKTETL